MTDKSTASPTSPLSAGNSHRATLTGLAAVLMWSTSMGLIRSVTELLGPLGGAAAIFSASAFFACMAFGLRVRGISPVYFWGGGFLFVAYEMALALAIGLAANRAQSMELGMINYLWPSLTIVLAVVTGQQRSTWLLWPSMALCLAGILLVLRGDGDLSVQMLLDNVKSNPVAYSLAIAAAFLWAMYTLVARRYGDGRNAVPAFLLVTASLFWLLYAFSKEAPLAFSGSAITQVLMLGLLTAAAYSCWNYGIQKGKLALLATASYFTPVLSMLLAGLWLGVAWGQGFVFGVLMVTGGSLMCWWATRNG